MDRERFHISLACAKPPADLAGIPLALWFYRKGDWAAAHHVAQDLSSEEGAWLHAFLHRVEGDSENAAYWYEKAGRTVNCCDFDQEYEQLLEHICTKD